MIGTICRRNRAGINGFNHENSNACPRSLNDLSVAG